MANKEVENPGSSFIDVRRTQATTNSALATPANYGSVSDLRARLTAISATTYTPARLDVMTKNDMVYAVRLSDDAAGVK